MTGSISFITYSTSRMDTQSKGRGPTEYVAKWPGGFTEISYVYDVIGISHLRRQPAPLCVCVCVCVCVCSTVFKFTAYVLILDTKQTGSITKLLNLVWLLIFSKEQKVQESVAVFRWKVWEWRVEGTFSIPYTRRDILTKTKINKSTLFWGNPSHKVFAFLGCYIGIYRRFGTICGSHLQGSRSLRVLFSRPEIPAHGYAWQFLSLTFHANLVGF